MKKPDKYFLYENAVQTPELNVEMYGRYFQEILGRNARRMREDFCGTFAVCCEWVKLHPENRALGLDLDPEPLAYGRRAHWSRLSASQKKRVEILRQNVLVPTQSKWDLITAGNFSFYIFKNRRDLIRYFQACYESLDSSGVLILDMLGGPGAIHKTRERKQVALGERKGARKYWYIWDQNSFNPITHDARYMIHFKLPDGTRMENAFVYDWRLWTIPEVRDALAEAGFEESCVFWETLLNGKGTDEYVRTEDGDNAYSWIAYVCGIKGKAECR